MIPCKDVNNCGENTISSKCVTWGGSELSCTEIPTCPKPSVEEVIVAIEENLCALNSTVGAVSGVTTGCAQLPSPVPDLSKVENHLQLIYNNLDFQKIDYSSQFTVSGSTECNKTLTIRYGEWVDITDDITFYNDFTSSSIEYMIEPASNSVRLKGTISRPDVMTGTTWSYSGSGNSLIVMDLPSYLKPNNPYLTCTPGINDSYRYSPGTMPTEHYNLTWITSIFNSSGICRMSTYVPYAATQDGHSVTGGNSVSLYLHNYHYSLI